MITFAPNFIEAIYFFTGGQFVMTEDDPGFAAVFAPYPAAYLSTTGAIVDSVRVLNNFSFLQMHC